MPFLGMAGKVRNDPMGPASMGLLKSNAELVRRLSLAEHIQSSGEHNAREIPRVVRRISGTTVSPSSTDITAVTNGTTGKYVLTLAGSRFDADWMAVQINPCGTDVANKPYMSGYRVVSATSLEVYFKKLTSTLGDVGDPNTWADVNVDFDIAIHSSRLAAGSFPTDLPANSVTGDPLKPTRWSALVQNAGDVYAVLDAEHDVSTGEHTTRQVASRSGLWRWDGVAVNLEAGIADAISVSRTSAGVYEVTSSSALSTQTHCFVSPDFSRYAGSSTDILRMHVNQVNTTKWELYVYSYNTSDFTWSRADGDFWLAMHNG
jgi:hypothetical protein